MIELNLPPGQQLYRITYLRKGLPCSVTFSAADAIDAADFSELWEKTMKLPVLTLVPLGASKFPAPAYSRRSQALPGGRPRSVTQTPSSMLTKDEQFQLEIKEAPA
jgi:hypothetical protein